MTARELFHKHLDEAQKVVDAAFAQSDPSLAQGETVRAAPEHLLVYKDFTFDASHILPKHPGKCSNLHGHTYHLRVGVKGPVDPETGFVIDFTTLKSIVQNFVINQVDHTHLGCGNIYDSDSGLAAQSDFYPTCENLILVFVRWLATRLDCEGVELVYLELKETPTSGCEWRKYGQ